MKTPVGAAPLAGYATPFTVLSSLFIWLWLGGGSRAQGGTVQGGVPLPSNTACAWLYVFEGGVTVFWLNCKPFWNVGALKPLGAVGESVHWLVHQLTFAPAWPTVSVKVY